MTQSTRTVLIAQVFISCMMAGLMTGIFGALKSGLTPEFLSLWGHSFIVAWPLAFVLSLGVGPIAFRLAWHVNRRLG